MHGAYKFGKMKFPAFSRPLKQFFHTIIMLKPDVTNHLTSHFSTFLALMQNYRIYFKEHGDRLHPRQSLCHTTNLCSACCGFQIASPKHTIWFAKISRVYFKFPWVFQNLKIPEFSRFSRVLSTMLWLQIMTVNQWMTINSLMQAILLPVRSNICNRMLLFKLDKCLLIMNGKRPF